MSDLTRLHTMDLFSRFFQENREKFLTFAYSYLRDRVEAEDVLMESMITLWEIATTGKKTATFTPCC